MTPERAKELLTISGAIIEGHFVGTNGSHLSVYIAKDRATRFPSIVSELCMGIAEAFAAYDIAVVVAPAIGGIALSQWTAHHLSRLRPGSPEVLALYSEHCDTVLYEYKNDIELAARPDEKTQVTIKKGDKTILRGSRFVLKRGFDKAVQGKNILAVEDVLTTGGSAALTVRAVSLAGGLIVGLGVLVNGGNVTAETCNVPVLKSLISINREIFTEEECADHGLCAKGIPINTEFGHGQEFLKRKRK